ncbi:transposase [Natrialbaceae archaeon GCM10025810]
MTGRADTEDEIAADIASSGSLEITEPRPRDYEYIAEKVADNVFPMHPKEDGYEGRGQEDVMAMARLHVYRHLVEDLESFPDAERHLKKYDGVVSRLGLEKPRSRETIRRSWNEQFDGAHDYIRKQAYDLRDAIGWGMDGVLMAMGVHDQSLSYPEFSPEGIRQSAKEDAYERIRPILTDVVDFERAENVSVPSEDLTDYAAWLARRREMTPESMNAYVADEELDEAPFDPETYRRALRNKEREKTKLRDGRTIWMPPLNPSVNLNEDYGGTDDWHSTTEEGIGRFVEELKDEGVIDGEVPVCIDGSVRDYHKHPDGADDRPEGVYRESYLPTNYGWKDLTATAIIDGRAVVLANVSMVPGDKTPKAVRYLIDRSLDLVDVEGFYADSAFASVANCRYIDHVGEDYVFKMRHTSGVKDELDGFTGKAAYTEYELEEGKSTRVHSTTLFAVEKRGKIDVKRGETRHDEHSQAGFEDFGFNEPEGQLTFADLAPDDDVEYVAFLTNKEINSQGIDPAMKPVAHDNERTVWGQAERYRRRWSIETAFRQIKYQFIPQTRSRDLGTRRFVWMMGILLLNAWAALNIFVRRWASQTFDEDDTDPPVPGKEMLDELAKTEHG